MIKVIIIFMIGLGLGYSIGYSEGASGQPSVMQKVMQRFGVDKVKERQERREQATEAVR